ncbi:MAG TPA: LptF/LptG family permease [Bacteroidia bacterium]|nr:LptF/LptG family permease [Bacteroidia bacterium]
MLVKTLHIYLIKKFIPPFMATLFIGMFIFFMIFLFTYIDEIIGKGVDNVTLAKMFGYMFITFLSPSMPLAILLSSIMTFGNLGENYELASMKSAGLSLLSIMRPILVFVFGLACFCFLFSNYTLPYIHLKAGRLLYDVRSSKPAVNIKESIFYNGIEGYSIRIGKKDNDGITIHNVSIYDHSGGRGNTTQMYAKDGQIFMSENKKFLSIKLFNGTRYEQPLKDVHEERTRPNMIMHFNEQEVNIDLSKVKMQQTDENLFKNNAEMMNIRLLTQYTDTSVKYRFQTYKQTYNQFYNSYYFQKSLAQCKLNDSLHNKQIISIDTYLVKLAATPRKNLIEGALNMARSADSFLASKVQEEENQVAEQAKLSTEWHKKFTVSFVCVILFFVGAPLGAIVRKGGFGMPVVISIFLFITYYVISITCEKMVLQDKLNDVIGMWIAASVFLPIGIWLSLKAANDSPLFDAVLYIDFFKKIFGKNKKQHAATANN